LQKGGRIADSRGGEGQGEGKKSGGGGNGGGEGPVCPLLGAKMGEKKKKHVVEELSSGRSVKTFHRTGKGLEKADVRGRGDDRKNQITNQLFMGTRKSNHKAQKLRENDAGKYPR